MEIITQYVTNSPCYKTEPIMEVKGLMLHSVGYAQEDPSGLIEVYNSGTYWGACVHGFITTDYAKIILPCMEYSRIAKRGWHGGGSSNKTHLGFEMMEPKCLKYTGNGAEFTVDAKDKKYAVDFCWKTVKNAVELFAKLCIFHKLNPLTDIVSHKEGYEKGIAANHADPSHLWDTLGMDYNMDKFRQDVYDKIKELTKGEDTVTLDEFKKLFGELRRELCDNDASNYSKDARDWAVREGLIKGVSTEEFNGAWEDFMTREQFTQLLYNFAKYIGKA